MPFNSTTSVNSYFPISFVGKRTFCAEALWKNVERNKIESFNIVFKVKALTKSG